MQDSAIFLLITKFESLMKLFILSQLKWTYWQTIAQVFSGGSWKPMKSVLDFLIIREILDLVVSTVFQTCSGKWLIVGLRFASRPSMLGMTGFPFLQHWGTDYASWKKYKIITVSFYLVFGILHRDTPDWGVAASLVGMSCFASLYCLSLTKLV